MKIFENENFQNHFSPRKKNQSDFFSGSEKLCTIQKPHLECQVTFPCSATHRFVQSVHLRTFFWNSFHINNLCWVYVSFLRKFILKIIFWKSVGYPYWKIDFLFKIICRFSKIEKLFRKIDFSVRIYQKKHISKYVSQKWGVYST